MRVWIQFFFFIIGAFAVPEYSLYRVNSSCSHVIGGQFSFPFMECECNERGYVFTRVNFTHINLNILEFLAVTVW